MSFFLTQEQIKNRTKTVTRRQGWAFLKPGDIVQAIEKGQGLKKGEKVKRLCLIKVEKVSREPISRILDEPEGTKLEGFPDMSAKQFIEFYCKFNKCKDTDLCTRIEFSFYHPPKTEWYDLQIVEEKRIMFLDIECYRCGTKFRTQNWYEPVPMHYESLIAFSRLRPTCKRCGTKYRHNEDNSEYELIETTN